MLSIPASIQAHAEHIEEVKWMNGWQDMTAASHGTEKETSIKWVLWQLFQGKAKVVTAHSIVGKEKGRTEEPG